MKELALLLLLATPAAAQTWSGATPRACMGRCDEAWAISQLTQDEQDQIAAAKKILGPATYIEVDDGDVFTFMTYFKIEPLAYHTHTVATLDKPEGSYGWTVGDWSWVKLNACQNWAIVRRPDISQKPVLYSLLTPVSTGFFTGNSLFPSGGYPNYPGGGNPPVIPPVIPPIIPPVIPPIVPSPIPLGGGSLALITALFSLVSLKIWSKQK